MTKTKNELLNLVPTIIFPNNQRLISPAAHRDLLLDFVNAMYPELSEEISSIPTWVQEKTYEPAPNLYVLYNNRIYEFVSEEDNQGTQPGTNADVWKEIDISAMAHPQNTDFRLGNYVVNIPEPTDIFLPFVQSNVISINRNNIPAGEYAISLKSNEGSSPSSHDIFVRVVPNADFTIKLISNDFQFVPGGSVILKAGDWVLVKGHQPTPTGVKTLILGGSVYTHKQNEDYRNKRYKESIAVYVGNIATQTYKQSNYFEISRLPSPAGNEYPMSIKTKDGNIEVKHKCFAYLPQDADFTVKLETDANQYIPGGEMILDPGDWIEFIGQADTAAGVRTLITAGSKMKSTSADSEFIPDSENAVQSQVIQAGLAGKSDTNHNHEGVYEPANENIQEHIIDKNNPHEVDESKWELVGVLNGLRVPTEAEWEAERISWGTNNAAGAFASPLKLTMAGSRSRSNGSLSFIGSAGGYLSSTVQGIYSRRLSLLDSTASMQDITRATGYSVRLVKHEPYTGNAIDFVSEEITINNLPYNTVLNETTNRIWLDKNLGATQVATGSTDSDAYGDLYQWGRSTDGHEKRDSATTATLSSTDQPGHGDFILTSNSPYDWRDPQNDNLWQGVEGINNPAPLSYNLEPKDKTNKVDAIWIDGDIVTEQAIINALGYNPATEIEKAQKAIAGIVDFDLTTEVGDAHTVNIIESHSGKTLRIVSNLDDEILIEVDNSPVENQPITIFKDYTGETTIRALLPVVMIGSEVEAIIIPDTGWAADTPAYTFILVDYGLDNNLEAGALLYESDGGFVSVDIVGNDLVIEVVSTEIDDTLVAFETYLGDNPITIGNKENISAAYSTIQFMKLANNLIRVI